MGVIRLNKAFSYYRSYYSFKSKREYFGRYLDMDPSVLLTHYTRPYQNTVCIAKRIQMRQLHFYSSPLLVMLKLGLPLCRFMQKSGKFKHQVYLYKSVFDSYCCYISCHFLKRRLVFIQLCFPNNDVELRKDVLTVLQQKYNFSTAAAAGDLQIYNRSGERLIMRNDVYLHLDYYADDCSFIYYLRQQQEFRSRHIQGKRLRKQEQLEALL